jgi:HAD superfamily hydrolase (TIGR01484 family)
MIKAIILDVDGVLVGSREGFNFPDPHPQVIEALKQIRAKGVFISLCTGKPYFAIEKIIRDAYLNNIHITEGGAVITNPIDQVVEKAYMLDSHLASQLIRAFLDNNVYTEFYNGDSYMIQRDRSDPSIVERHFKILQKEPTLVDSLEKAVMEFSTPKVMPIARDESERVKIESVFTPFSDKLSLKWAIHPTALPLEFGIITNKGISKHQAAIDISESLGVSLENILGVGDTLMDWDFIEICGYGAAMGNASSELKDLVLTKGPDYSYIGPDVDENGILDIFRHFGLLGGG